MGPAQRAADTATGPGRVSVENIPSEPDRLPDQRIYGRVTVILGLSIEVGGVHNRLPIGDHCRIKNRVRASASNLSGDIRQDLRFKFDQFPALLQGLVMIPFKDFPGYCHHHRQITLVGQGIKKLVD